MSLHEHLKRIFDVFSNRQSTTSNSNKLDEISSKLRNRILLLYRDNLSGLHDSLNSHGNREYEFWSAMHNSLQNFKGEFRLSKRRTDNDIDDAVSFVTECSTNDFLNFIELSFKLNTNSIVFSNDADLIDAINVVFRYENAPYELTHFVKKEVEVTETSSSFPFRSLPGSKQIITVAFPRIIRVDDQVIQKEVITPALTVLSNPEFEAANLEYLDALKDYREGNYGDCLTKCNSSLESVLKVICRKNKWQYNENDTLKPLLDTFIDRAGLDPFLKQPLMITGTIRNKKSTSHGGGSEVRIAKRSIAQYVISSTAAAISLIVEECDR